MNSIQAIAYLLLISTICCNAKRMDEDEDDDDSSVYDTRRSFERKFFDDYLDKRVAVKSVCTGSAKCADSCDPKKSYDSSSTCGLVCFNDKWQEKVGSTGTCQRDFNLCGGASSTFCPGGTYTSIRNTFPNNPSYFDCANGSGCGGKGGCCVRVAGTTAKTWNYYCLKCSSN